MEYSANDHLTLPPDIILAPVSTLSEQVRRQFSHQPGDYAITHPRSRKPTKIVSAQAAALLDFFRSPTTIVGGVLDYSQSVGANPEDVLTDAYPLLRSLILARLLVPDGSLDSKAIAAEHKSGSSVAGYEIIRSIQILADTELYHVRYGDRLTAVFKIARPEPSQELRRMFLREEGILRHLDGQRSPSLYDAGTVEGRPYLVMAWCPGAATTIVADEIRRYATRDSKDALLDLCGNILDSYVHLHQQGVIHGDVHPRNLLVDRHGIVRIIDFGLANRESHVGEFDQTQRGGVAFFLEPEYARAISTHAQPPRATANGEQYALAALLYLVLTGSHYLDFSLERLTMLRQITEDTLRSLAERGLEDCYGVEQVLLKALSKEPGARFSSMHEFSRCFHHAIENTPRAKAIRVIRETSSVATAVQRRVLAQIEPHGDLFKGSGLRAPTCSVKLGAAGIAYALYRMACLYDSAELLSQAHLWITKARRSSQTEEAWYSSELDISLASVGKISTFHTASGLHCVRAIIAHAMGDFATRRTAITRFMQASSGPCENLDLTLGRASTLLGCILLLDTVSAHQASEADALVSYGQRILNAIWGKLQADTPIPESRQMRHLGIAHGWAGLLYATLLWHRSARTALPVQAQEHLEELAALAEPIGRGARWKWLLDPDPGRKTYQYMPGWCNGSSGYIHLWTLAHRVFGDDRYLDLAEQAGWNTWEEAGGIHNLCCGLAGCAYGLLNLFRYTGENAWLERARVLAERAATAGGKSDLPAYSLYKGMLGVAVLAADLASPEQSCMPFFEVEGWRRS